MKSVRLIVIAVLLLIVAGVTATVGLAPVTKEVETAAQNAAGPDFEHPYFVKMGHYVLPVIRNDDLKAQVSISIGVEVGSSAAVDKVHALMPVLRDAYFRDLNRTAVWRDPETGYSLPLVQVKRRLRRISDRILGPGVIREVLVGGILERKL